MACCILRVSLISRVCTLHSAAPASRAPSFLNASHVNSTAVLVAWGGIACSHQNGNISLFELDITLAGRSRRVRVGGDASEGGMSVLTGLQPESLYSIRVAAVNLDDQTGVFTSVATIQTMEAGMLICRRNSKPQVVHKSPPTFQTTPQHLIMYSCLYSNCSLRLTSLFVLCTHMHMSLT